MTNFIPNFENNINQQSVKIEESILNATEIVNSQQNILE